MLPVPSPFSPGYHILNHSKTEEFWGSLCPLTAITKLPPPSQIQQKYGIYYYVLRLIVIFQEYCVWKSLWKTGPVNANIASVELGSCYTERLRSQSQIIRLCNPLISKDPPTISRYVFHYYSFLYSFLLFLPFLFVTMFTVLPPSIIDLI